MRAVFDAFALMAWLQEERGAPQVEEWLARADRKEMDIFVSIVNLGQVYYRLQRLGQAEAADEFMQDIRTQVIPFKTTPATNRRVWAASQAKGKISHCLC